MSRKDPPPLDTVKPCSPRPPPRSAACHPQTPRPVPEPADTHACRCVCSTPAPPVCRARFPSRVSKVLSLSASESAPAHDQEIFRPMTASTGACPRRPSGVLLYGPPGCGKTHLLRCVVADAGLVRAVVSPFFSRAGGEWKVPHTLPERCDFTFPSPTIPTLIISLQFLSPREWDWNVILSSGRADLHGGPARTAWSSTAPNSSTNTPRAPRGGREPSQ